jgi:hypothetical protein
MESYITEERKGPSEKAPLLDLTEARKTIGGDAFYLDPTELQRVDDNRILRYDLTLPLLMTIRFQGQPPRISTTVPSSIW